MSGAARYVASSYMFWSERFSERQLAAVRASGIDEVEVFCYEPHFPWSEERTIAQLRKDAQNAGLHIASGHAPWSPDGYFDISALDEQRRAHTVEETIKALGAVAALGGRRLIVHPGGEVQSVDEQEQRVSASLRSLEAIGRAAVESGVAVLVENTPPGDLGSDREMIRRFLTRPTEGIGGFCLDAGHANLAEAGYEPFLRPPLWPQELHVSDNMGTSDDHLFPGEGRIDWKSLMHAVFLEGASAPPHVVFELELFPGSEKMAQLVDLFDRYSRHGTD